MSKIINTKTNEVLFSDSNLYVSGAVIEFLQTKEIGCTMYPLLSKLIETMTGDASTPFNTIAEMVEYIPDIMTASEETAILQVWGDEIFFFVLGWDYEEDEKLFTKIIQTVLDNKNLQCIECE